MLVKCNKTISLFKKDTLYIVRNNKEFVDVREYATDTTIIMSIETFKNEYSLFFDMSQSPIKQLEKCLSL